MKYFCSDCENYKAKIQQQAQTIEKLIAALDELIDASENGGMPYRGRNARIAARQAMAEAREK